MLNNINIITFLTYINYLCPRTHVLKHALYAELTYPSFLKYKYLRAFLANYLTDRKKGPY